MGKGQRIAVVSVINDLVSDSRVHKIAETLFENQFSVTVIGRLLPSSPPLTNTSYKTTRLKLVFKSGPLFYFFFQIRLLIKLFSLKADLLYANDLDTLLPNYLVSRFKNIPLIYDSHEVFCEVPELQHTRLKKKIWESLERFLVPKIKFRITVNRSIADHFYKKYQTPFEVVRNIPALSTPIKTKSKKDLNLPDGKRIIIMQGAGINMDRGAEELVAAMKYVDNALLLIVGAGDVWKRLEELSRSIAGDKIKLISRLPKTELIQYTLNADIGISIDKNTNLNYYYSLPNKLFDYIHSGLPVLVSRLPEIERIVEYYRVGEFISDHQPQTIAAAITNMLNGNQLGVYRQNAKNAAIELSWDKEKAVLESVIQRATGKIEVAINS